MMYYAICTSTWMPNDVPDESFASDNFFEAVSFCSKRYGRLKAAIIIEERDGKEREIVSFRTVR